MHDKILVVGTTSDYIEWIRQARPGSALFLTDPRIRVTAGEPDPDPGEEILSPLDDIKKIQKKVADHIHQFQQNLAGIACFDCEWMELAAQLAQIFKLSYPTPEAVRNCRDKYICKKIWKENRLPCPEVETIQNVEQAAGFLEKNPDGIVLKPFYGSGSELVFRCRNAKECEDAFSLIKDGLEKRKDAPLFKKNSSHEHLMTAESYISGTEFSCDFMVDGSNIQIIRQTRKIKSHTPPFGTILGYIFPSSWPCHYNQSEFEDILLRAATVLGIRRSICMVDFMIRDSRLYLIEITPRPGGDCIPDLLKASCGIDIIGITMDFAVNRPIDLCNTDFIEPHIGMRIFAKKNGIFKGFDTTLLENEPRVKKIVQSKKPGHRVIMPPDDYDSRLLGHMIIRPKRGYYPETQGLLIAKRLRVEMTE